MLSSDSDDSVDRMLMQRHGGGVLSSSLSRQQQSSAKKKNPTRSKQQQRHTGNAFRNETNANDTACDHNSDNDDDDESSMELEVLPPKKVGHRCSLGSTTTNDVVDHGKPQLRFSGMDSSDPVELLLSDEEKSSSTTTAPRCRGAPLKQSKESSAETCELINLLVDDDDNSSSSFTKRQQQSVVKTHTPRTTNLNIDDTDVDDSSKRSQARQLKPQENSLLDKREENPYFQMSDDYCPQVTNNDSQQTISSTNSVLCNSDRKCPPTTMTTSTTTTTTAQYTTTTHNDDDDSDAASSVDSLKALREKVAAAIQRKRAPVASVAPTTKKSKTATTTNAHTTIDKGGKPTAAKQQKEAEKLQRQEARDKARHEKEAAKAAAALEKERLRNAKQAEKVAKQQEKTLCAQASGKLAKSEIAVLLQRDKFPPDQWTLLADLEETGGYLVQEHPSALQCNAVQWIRKDAIHGGAKAAVEHLHQHGAATKVSSSSPADGYQHLPVIAIVVDDAREFLKLLDRTDRCSSSNDNDSCTGDDFGDDYPALEMWLKGIEYGWRAAWSIPSESSIIFDKPQRPRMILLLDRVAETLDKLWIEHGKAAARRTSSNTPPTAEELHDAIAWILIQFQVECVHCTSPDDTSAHLMKMTRVLSEEPYKRTVTDLECIQKLKPECTDTDPPAVRAQDCWMRQLQQIPRISRPMAQYMTHFFPTAQSLYQAYTSDRYTIDEKKLLAAHAFAPNRNLPKLSGQLYTIMMSNDPNAVLR